MLYRPLFPNTKAGLPIAASDIATVPSLAGSEPLTTGQWRLSRLTQESSSSPFILLEKRNFFGDRIAQKFNEKGEALPERQAIHPDKTTRDFREKLFGLINPSTYWAQSVLLNEGQDLFSTNGTLILSQIGGVKQSPKRFITQGDLLGIDPTSQEGQLLQQGNKFLQHDSTLVKHENALQDAGVYDLAAVRRGFKDLEGLSPKLNTYCKTFYWTMANFFEAYRSLSTGLFQGNSSAEITTKEQMGAQIVKKGASYVATALKSIPIVGSAVGILDMLIDDTITIVAENRFENKVNAIMNITRKKLQMAQDINSTIAKVALAVTREREQAILNTPPKEVGKGIMGKMDRLKSSFEENLAALKSAILPSIELNDPEDSAVQLALKDVTLTMAYLFKHHDEIIKRNDSLDVQMITIVRNGGLEKLLSAPPSQQISNSSQNTNNVKNITPTTANNNSKTADVPTVLNPSTALKPSKTVSNLPPTVANNKLRTGELYQKPPAAQNNNSKTSASLQKPDISPRQNPPVTANKNSKTGKAAQSKTKDECVVM